METPWGRPDNARQIAEGITLYSTPSHGGYHLSPEKHARVVDLFPAFKTTAGGPWYEEDCDAAIVPLVFPGLFQWDDLQRAVKAARCFAARTHWRNAKGWQQVVDWLDTSWEGDWIKVAITALETGAIPDWAHSTI